MRKTRRNSKAPRPTEQIEQLAPPGAGQVAVAFLHPGTVAGGFAASLAGMLKVSRGAAALMARMTGPRIATARNAVCREFLSTQYEWLLFVDADMQFPPNSLDLLMEGADKDIRPVMGGLCFAKQEGLLFPTIYRLNDEQTQFMPAVSYPRGKAFMVDGTGAAFLLIHRTALETLLALMPNHPAPWFQETIDWDPVTEQWRERGEDLTFCLRLRKADIPVWIDARVRIDHVKQHEIGEGTFEEQQRRPKPVLCGAPGAIAADWLEKVFGRLRIPVGIGEAMPLDALLSEGAKMQPSPFALEISWAAAAYLKPGYPAPVVHVLEDPRVAASNLLASGMPPAAVAWPGSEELDDVTRAAACVTMWTEATMQHQTAEVRMRDLADPATLSELTQGIGYSRSLSACQDALASAGPMPSPAPIREDLPPELGQLATALGF